MKLKVPFVRNLKKWKGNGWCGPLALASILRFYKIQDKVEDIVNLSSISKNKTGSSPNGLINFSLNKGLKVDYYSEVEFEKENNPKYSKGLRTFLKKIKAEKNDLYFFNKNKRNPNFKLIKRKATLKDIKNNLNNGKPVLILHNVAVIFNREDKLWPHYIAIVGYDKENFYIHNVAIKNQAFQKVNQKIINKSWNCGGLKNTLIVPYLEK